MNHVELFAGCGGLSLGLDKAGFDLVLANELSPMAAETFAYNFFDEDFEDLADKKQMPHKAIWLSSKFNELKPRLRENPFEYPQLGGERIGFSDFKANEVDSLNGKLVVGSIVELNNLIESNSELKKLISGAFGRDGGLDLVSGGPPCQGFSMAGKREKDSDKNSLPWEFARFVQNVKPKIVLLENVTGILRAFKDEKGKQFHAWYEVSKAFATIGYVPLCLHVNARHAGVAQNRPRFLMIALRRDMLDKLEKQLPEKSFKLFEQSINFYQQVQLSGGDIEFGHLDVIDTMAESGANLIKGTFLQHLYQCDEVSVREALDDLKTSDNVGKSSFVDKLNDTFSFLKPHPIDINHGLRSNSELVKRRFRIYQILQELDSKSITKDVFSVLKGTKQHIEPTTWEAIRESEFRCEKGELLKFSDKVELETYLKQHPTKKQTQKALDPDLPAPAALSIPDDACHYDPKELRVLTVREMARIQSFPDNFVFRSKATTGGQMRKFEVPQYTQVGNAVPPLLALAVGNSIKELLQYK
ncbi:DNA cytosine methyltransferase [Vibrio tubiashii]|uniref:DNA cytosine methyltransferase n=1 Tax=Vibrio tubiashii TaxID=29498 RepID=UPI00234F7B95|nr:DNA cytosine methyltransferase [Vibrio tubiashii]WCP70098.1 DNA cytosine methyltransferase [Vibrio tubiashii]